MKTRNLKYLIAGVLSLPAAVAHSAPYIVLFNDVVEAGETPAEQEALISHNEANIDVLSNWMSTRKMKDSPIANYWLIQGASVDLTPEDATRLASERWVASVIEDRQQAFLAPINDLDVQASAPAQGSVWGLANIGVPQARAAYPTLTGRGVKVGIIDTGIEGRHMELLGTGSVVFRDFVSGIPNAYDDHGHGTHVAGTIAGRYVGIAPQSDLIVAKALSALGYGTYEWLVSAMQWMADPDGNPRTNDRPKLVSNSWGGGASKFHNLNGGSALFARAIHTWIQLGIMPIFAAGNSGNYGLGTPGALQDAIAIGAYDEQNNWAYFSSTGPVFWEFRGNFLSLFKPDISAPGVRVTSAFPGGQYATWSGTSMATPHVSGALALAFQKNPGLTYAQVKSLLVRTSTPVMNLSLGAGRLNLVNLLRAVP